jgi:hypothetical protein
VCVCVCVCVCHSVVSKIRFSVLIPKTERNIRYAVALIAIANATKLTILHLASQKSILSYYLTTLDTTTTPTPSFPFSFDLDDNVHIQGLEI